MPHGQDGGAPPESNGRRGLLRAGLSGWACAALPGLSGCAALATPDDLRTLLAAPPAGLARRFERTDLPFFPQTPQHCGPAALATVLQAGGWPADPQALGEAVFLPGREGSLQLEMLAGARRAGAVAFRLPARLDALMSSLQAGHAPVLLLNLSLAWWPRWHYAVLAGWDLEAGLAWLRSGTERRAEFSLGALVHTWQRAGAWAFVVLPPGQLPAEVDLAAAAEGALGFEHAAGAAAAVPVWQSLVRRFEAALLPRLALANAWAASGQPEPARALLLETARQTGSAAAWNNLAQLRLDAGDRAGAREAAAQALRRARQAEPAWVAAAEATWAAVGGGAWASP